MNVLRFIGRNVGLVIASALFFAIGGALAVVAYWARCSRYNLHFSKAWATSDFILGGIVSVIYLWNKQPPEDIQS